MEKKQESDPHTCPSFSSYSSDSLAETAARVAAGISNDAVQTKDDEDFEFALAINDTAVPAADDQIGTVFPVFDGALFQNRGCDGESTGERKQLDSIEDGDNSNGLSCSSSEADELENIPMSWFCRPKVADQPPASQCKKSKSTGSASKKWKFSDFLMRSNSEGAKDNFVFSLPKNREEKLPGKTKGKGVGGGEKVEPSAHEAMYVQKRSIMEGNKNKSYLPYRRDLVGFFGNVNGSGKSFSHF
ncbi:hypothetical protein CASFOL_026438 [Castilleja foliolosa]|uniref:Uncharacterized protein n=1 Tax=Castilleja foliolosa TaxID=1961234 RepID=A0ABD3CJT2_9LAMI